MDTDIVIANQPIVIDNVTIKKKFFKNIFFILIMMLNDFKRALVF